MDEDLTTAEEVEQELNLVEKLADEASSADEYFEALIKNQRVLTRAVMAQSSNGGSGGFSVEGVGTTIPDDTAGLVISGATEGDLAQFLYKKDGRTIISDVEAARPMSDGEVAKFDTANQALIPASDVTQGDLDFGNISKRNFKPSDFEYHATPSDDNVTVDPGDKETVLEVNLTDSKGLYEVGTNDETYSYYQYIIDGEELLDQKIPQPLGLYNNRYEFPAPIKVESSLEVVVYRGEDAGASQDYFSNVVMM